VQAPVSRDVSTFVDEDALKDLHHEEGMKALAAARALLERAQVPCVVHIGVATWRTSSRTTRTSSVGARVPHETGRSQGSALGEVVSD